MTVKPLKTIIQQQAYHLVWWQLAGVIGLALVAFILSGTTSGISVLLGGMAYGIANLIFVWRVFRYSRPHEMPRFMAAFFFGEMLKLLLSGILFLLIVKVIVNYLPISLLSVLIGFIGAIVSFWIVCIIHFSKQTSLKQGVAND